MEILFQLGANKTAFIQFAIFIISVFILTKFIYTPFFVAYDERVRRTKGAEAVAKDSEEEAKNIAAVYQLKARQINEKIKSIFDAQKSIGLRQAGEILAQSKAETDRSISAARNELEKQKSEAQNRINEISAEISTQLKQKFESGL
jgi:F-type H+-transporting ATPase subunit b